MDEIKTTLDIAFFDDQDECVGEFTFHNPLCIPAVGEDVWCVASRDEDGNYHPEGKKIRDANGVVIERTFSFEQRGKSPSDYIEYLYVELKVKM